MRLFSIILLLVFSTFNVHATELSDAVNELCEKMKVCGQEQLAQQDLPPEMAQMMEGMFNGMCQAIVAPYVASTQNAGLEDKAVACLNSFKDRSCQELMENNAGETEECEEFEEAANEAYPDGIPGQ
jgi:hypothetical protein